MQRHGLKLLDPPAVEPLAVSDPVVKQHLRVIDTAEDALIALLLGKTREAAEQICRRAFITQRWLMTLDGFPRSYPQGGLAAIDGVGLGWSIAPGPVVTAPMHGARPDAIAVPLPPLQAVESVRYWDASAGAQLTLDPSAYLVDAVSEPGRLVPAPGTAWPLAQHRPNAVEITFLAGYGDDPASVPAGIKNWMLMMAGTLYENRELVAILNRGQIKELPIFDGLLDAYRVLEF